MTKKTHTYIQFLAVVDLEQVYLGAVVPVKYLIAVCEGRLCSQHVGLSQNTG